MLRDRGLVLGILAGVLLIQFSLATVLIINSGDWRATYLGVLYGERMGYKTFVLSSLGDADILSRSIPQNASLVVFETSKNSILHNAGKYFKLKGYTNVSSIVINDLYSDQLKLDSKMKSGCIMVIPHKFTIDALSAAPYSLINNCTVLFWDYGHASTILNYLKSRQGSARLVFFGDIETRPWVFFPNATVIPGGPRKINQEMVEKVLNYYKARGERLWVVLTTGDSIEQGMLVEKLPILVYTGNPEETAKFLLSHDVHHVEAVGTNMVNIASRVRDASHKVIGVVVKFGRTFTGIPGLVGRIFPLNIIIGNAPNPHMSVYGVYVDNSGKALVVLKDDGNTNLMFSIPGFNLVRKGRQLASTSDLDVYKVKPGQYFPVVLNVSSGDYSGAIAELYAIYGQEIPLNLYVGNGTPPDRLNFTLTSLSDNSNISVVDAKYFVRGGKVVVRIKNIGKAPVYVYGDLINFTYGNKSVTIAPLNYTFIQPGRTGELDYPMFLSKKEMDRNHNVTVVLFYGKKYPLLVNKMIASTQLGEYNGFLSSITGMLVAMASSPWFYIILVFVVLVYVYYARRGKAKHHKKRRKSRKKRL